MSLPIERKRGRERERARKSLPANAALFSRVRRDFPRRLISLLHLQSNRARSLSDRERPALGSRVESLHGTRTVCVALRNVQFCFVHAQVVLRVTRGGEQRRQYRFARFVRHKFQHDQALFVRFTADAIQHSANFERGHVDVSQVAHGFLFRDFSLFVRNNKIMRHNEVMAHTKSVFR